MGTGGTVIVASSPALREAAILAVRRSGLADPVLLGDDAALLRAVVAQIGGFGRILIERGLPGFGAELVDALAEASPQAVISVLESDAGPEAVTTLLASSNTPEEPPTPPLRPGGLMLRYQPIVSLRDGRIEMVEALARWASEPVAVTPNHFVPAIEFMGLGRVLARAVTRLATQDMARMPWPVCVTVNLSVAEFERRDVASWLALESRRARLPASRLAIELTEATPVRDVSRLAHALRRLRAAGHEVLMDDVILDDPRRRLLHLPFTGVKLDRSLTRLARTSARARNQIRSLCGTGLAVTAEGISSRGEARLLRALGVRRGQGFWLARPLPAQALAAWAQRSVSQPRKARP
ncbi:EAL domain-containing protein [Sabulicella rubraurantiaca]|uniref:EAL domain-containing protein n=1 Tax=Sabulicella rubraurantiaca TaxID=2811429 RepID=UPI001A9781A8|nr:EAL domain-containing protein [Sabulicella rubraurantiaca]